MNYTWMIIGAFMAGMLLAGIGIGVRLVERDAADWVRENVFENANFSRCIGMSGITTSYFPDIDYPYINVSGIS